MQGADEPIEDVPTWVPAFTGSVDAKVPAENVTLSHFMAEAARWLAVSEASDGRVFFGTGNTEPLARRAAGLRTLAHLENRANGNVEGLSQREKRAARAELAVQLEELARMVAGYNGRFPSRVGREVILIQVRTARDLVRANAKRGLLARIALPALLFLSGAFAEGVIGVYAQRCVETLTRILSS
jgi:hypothetical protein